MEKFPGAPSNKIEKAAEHIPTRESVLAAMETYVGEGAVVTKELSDEKGLYLLEVETPGENEGEVTKHEYIRKGRHATGYLNDRTEINVSYYENGAVVLADQVARLDEATGEWITL